MVHLIRIFSIFMIAALLVACDEKKETVSASQEVLAKAAETNMQIFQVRGVIKEIKPDSKTVSVRHEDIPGYMQAMTMDLETRDTDVSKFAVGDYISFRMLVTDNDGWIDQLKKVEGTAPKPTELPSRGNAFRPSRDVEMLNIGDALPEYSFTNQSGENFKTTDFKGKALAIHFIFTSCPFPTYCPRMSQNFSQALQKLKESSNGPTNYHFLSITIDPERDSPQVLEAYGKTHSYDPQVWTYATGDPIEIRAITEQFGQTFWKEGGTINHNLRTIVLNGEGLVHKILPSNEWQVDELVEAIATAAKKK